MNKVEGIQVFARVIDTFHLLTRNNTGSSLFVTIPLHHFNAFGFGNLGQHLPGQEHRKPKDIDQGIAEFASSKYLAARPLSSRGRKRTIQFVKPRRRSHKHCSFLKGQDV